MSDQDMMSPDGAAAVIDTDYTIGQDNVASKFGPFYFDVHNPVFLISGAVIFLFVAGALAMPEQAGTFFQWLRPAVTSTFDWFLLGAGNVFVILCLFLIVTPLGSVRLGGADARPDYTYVGWFSMLFAAGMGIGLMFYGVAEPISHYGSSFGGVAVENGARTDWAPLGGAAGDAEGARLLGMAATIFHWGLHPWAIYAIVALALALFAYNKGLPLTLRSAFYPLFGDAVWGWVGHLIDVIAVFATLFGLATSLGIGAGQANAGLNFLFGVGNNEWTQVILIAAITLIALTSVVAGLDAGVKRLSEINMVLAAALLAFIILVGPTMDIITGFFSNLVAYAEYLPALSNPFGREDTNFVQGWTAFYWAWWISWSPFVGMFIARVSRGRTVREFIICVLLIPSLVCVLWMTAFGGVAISQVAAQGITSVAEASDDLKLFEMLRHLPLTGITSALGIVLVIVFFVTSSDSGSLVIDTVTAGGKVDSPTPQRVFWCLLEGLVAIALLLGGGLNSLQAMAVSTGLPFTALLLLACVAIVKGLAAERAVLKGRPAAA